MKIELTDRLVKGLVIGVVLLAIAGVSWLWLDYAQRSGVDDDRDAMIAIDTLRITRRPAEIAADSLRRELERVEAQRQAAVSASLALEAEAEAVAAQAESDVQARFSRLRTQVDSAAQILVDSLQVDHDTEVTALKAQSASRLKRIGELEHSLEVSTAFHRERDTIEASLREEIAEYGHANSGLRRALMASEAKRSLERKLGLGITVLAFAVGAASN